VELGVTVSESQIQEAEHTTIEKRSDIQRQYQRGVIVGEQEVRHEKSETHTLRVTLINCVKNYMDARTTEMFGGASHNELTVASSAIQVACRDPDNVFPDVEFHDMPFFEALKYGVRRLKELHKKAIESLTVCQGSEPSPEPNPELSQRVLLAPDSMPKSLPSDSKLWLNAVQPLISDDTSLFEVAGEFAPEPFVVADFSVQGSLIPLVLASQLKEVKEAMYVVCEGKELHPLYALHATACHAWHSMLEALSKVFAVWPQHLPTNQTIESQQFKDINTALKHQDLPSVKSKPDWTCGLSKQHFEALGFLANKNGAWIWSLLDCVNRLHFDRTLYYSWVASSQLKARCAYDKLGELGIKKTFHFINTSVNALPPAIMFFTSPSLSMHLVNSEHEDVSARVRIGPLIPPPKNKKTSEQGEFLIHLPHQYMMLLLAEVEKAGLSGAMDFYCHSRRNSIVACIRSQYSEMKATNKRSVFGIPLDERLLKHPAFQPLLDHTTRNRIC
jgi:hypothetical protein